MSGITTVDLNLLKRQAWGQVALDAMRKPNSNDQGNMLVAQGMPKYYEAARSGKIFTKWFDDAGTAKAPLAATPLVATASTWSLFNDNGSSSNICLVPLRFWAILISGTGAIGGGLACQVPRGDQTRYTADATGIHTSNLNGGSGVGAAYLGTGKTLIGAQAAWNFYAGSMGPAAAATAASAAYSADCEGLYIVPPQGIFAMEVLSGVGTSALFGIGVTYMETNIDTL